MISTIDEYDNLVLEIAELGRCTTNMLSQCIGPRINGIKELTTDSVSAYQEFCSNYNIKLHVIPSGFHSDGNINIAEINGIHSQLETWLGKLRGVSIRHFQEYLDWFVYIFTMKKRFRLRKIKTESYRIIILDNNYIKSNDIFSIEIPIDLMLPMVNIKISHKVEHNF